MKPPKCLCGQTMIWYGDNMSWTCAKTLDHNGYPRPKKGHLHFVDPEDVTDDGDIKLGIAGLLK